MFANQNKTAEEIAQTLDGRVSLSNVHHIISTFQKENRIDKLRTGGSKPKFTADERELVAQLQTQHNDWTYNQIREEWKQRTGSNKNMSVGSIYNILREYGITTKQLYIVPEARNSDRLIEERFRYAQANVGRDSDRIIYVDEMGFSLHRARHRGRSLVGRRATITRPSARGGNISVCAAISPKYGLVKKKVQIGAFTAELFTTFLTEVFNALPASARNKEHFIVMDNVQFHRSRLVKALFDRVKHKVSYVPAYSPQLNAIEECFSSVASHVNTQRINNQTALMQLIDRAFNTITADKCAKWHEHVVEWLRLCLERKPLEETPPVDEEFYQEIRNADAANRDEEKKDDLDDDDDDDDDDDADEYIDENDSSY